MATSSLMLKMPWRKSRMAVVTIGKPRITEPIRALPLATIVPLSNSQSTTKAFATKTTPTNVCHQRTGACSWPQPQESSCSCWWATSFLLKSDVTCINYSRPRRCFDSWFRKLTIKKIPQFQRLAIGAFRHHDFVLHIGQHTADGLGKALLH